MAEGKSQEDAEDIGHDAAKTHWNNWAEARVAEREVLKKANSWATEKNILGRLEFKNEETREWMQKAEADFSNCVFLVKGTEEQKPKQKIMGFRRDGTAIISQPSVSIVVCGSAIDFRGFVFPGTAHFDEANFSGYTLFNGTIFHADVIFTMARFSENAKFVGASISGVALFDLSDFLGWAWFNNTTFSSMTFFTCSNFKGFSLL